MYKTELVFRNRTGNKAGNWSGSRTGYQKMVKRRCRFCLKRTSVLVHMCSKKYCYNYIFKQFFVGVMLDHKPKDYLDFFCHCMKVINKNELFSESMNPSDLVRDNLLMFINDYDCFP